MWKPGPRAVNVALRVGVFVFLALAGEVLFGWVFLGLLEPRRMISAVLTGFSAAVVANALAMRIWEQRTLLDAGLAWNAASVRNLFLGMAGGAGAALLVLGGAILEGAAELSKTGQPLEWGVLIFVPVMLLFGAIGEEMLFHGYAFQVLLGELGAFATILPMSVLFASLHSWNPNVTALGLLNTALWGFVLGYAFWRSGDLWLPIGLHFGWNWMLPLFGANLSGFTMNLTGCELRWRTGPLWSGGAYGPEGGIATTLAVGALFVWLMWKAPVKRQTPYLVREHWDD
jgi:membrane protease YdiL (CAAX protease family)